MKKEIKQEIKKLIDVSQKKEQKQKDFMSDKKLLNTKTGEMKDMNYCLIVETHALGQAIASTFGQLSS